jgi:8-oxo-dGTP diphosphatase
MIKYCHVGVKGVVCVDGQCLVLKKGTGINSYWDIPGGRIDGNETLEETLHRELHEELPTIGNYKVGDVLGAYRLSKNIENDTALILVFYLIHAEVFEVLVSEEHTDYRWVTQKDVAELLSSDTHIESGYYDVISRAVMLG